MPNFAWSKAELLIYHMAVRRSFSRNLDKSLITTVPQGTAPVKQSRGNLSSETNSPDKGWYICKRSYKRIYTPFLLRVN